MRNFDEFCYNVRGELSWARYGTNSVADIYDYDFVGNFTSNRLRNSWSHFEANELNEYASIADGSPRFLAYDLDGNLLTNGVWSFSYDSQNRLSSVSSNGCLVVIEEYDSKSRRVVERSCFSTNYFVYDNWNTIRNAFRSDFGTNVVNLFWGKDISGNFQDAGGAGGLLAEQNHTRLYFPFYDNIGNIVSYQFESGTCCGVCVYDGFGRILNDSFQNVVPASYQFSTKPFGVELYYYGYRFYYPKLGRWLNRDPLMTSSGFGVGANGLFQTENEEYNDYIFSKNAPTYVYDKYGLFCDQMNMDRCRLVCEQKSRGFLSFHYTCTPCLWLRFCKCFGICQLIFQTRPDRLSGARNTCTYNCGFERKVVLMSRPCPDIGLWKL
jgi:RHS repeat-associated protein